MKYRRLPVLFVECLFASVNCILVIGCAASHEQIYKEVTPEQFDKAVFKTAKSLGYSLYAQQSGVDSASHSGAYGIYHYGSSVTNNTGFSSHLEWNTTASGIMLSSSAYTMSGDAHADANFFPAAVQQQIEIDKGLRVPFRNPPKSVPVFLVYNLLSPTLATWYLTKDNPLISSKMLPYVYMQSGIGEWPSWVATIIYAVKPTHQSRDAFFGLLGLSAAWRLLCLIYLADLKDYGVIARSPYNLAEIAHEY